MWLPISACFLLAATASSFPLRSDLSIDDLLQLQDLTPEEYGALARLYEKALLEQIPGKVEDVDSVNQNALFDNNEKSKQLTAIHGWPSPELQLGQVVGLGVCEAGNVHVLHRADRVWNYGTFDSRNNYQGVKKGPIEKPVILTLNPDDGKTIHSLGEKIPGCDPSSSGFCGFYLPHGLTIDFEGNRWVTDVALHQVVRIPHTSAQPDLILGQKLQPGSGSDMFCKPTDVAVLKDGSFYVADGYCNSRVIKHFANGSRELELGTGEFAIPHSLAAREDLDLLCVADREHGRIVCYRISTNQRFGTISSKEFGGRLFAIEFHPSKPLLFAVNGPNQHSQPVSGFSIDVISGDIVARWAPPSGAFSAPHDVTADKKDNVYVGEISPNKLWRFN